uniref:Uncharacterized protein n=1 Tax=Arundo donax TaxID=35708 RepID=A0A0A9BZI5_ARUDO
MQYHLAFLLCILARQTQGRFRNMQDVHGDLTLM